MNELKKNDLIKARKRNIFRFIDNLNSINDGGEFVCFNYSNIYPEELQLGKENTDKQTSFLDLNIKI